MESVVAAKVLFTCELADDGSLLLHGFDAPAVTSWCDKHGKRVSVSIMDMTDADGFVDPPAHIVSD